MDMTTKPEAIQAKINGSPKIAGDNATVKGSPLSRYETIEKAKQVLATDRRIAFESARTLKRRQNELQRQETLAAEQHAREQLRKSKESADEYTSRLMEEMKTSVIKRFEADLYATARANVTREFDSTLKAGLKKAMRNEVYEELCTELQPVVEADLASKLYHQVKDQLKEELKPVVEAEIRAQAQEELEEAAREQNAAHYEEEVEQLEIQDIAEETLNSSKLARDDDPVQRISGETAPEAAGDAPFHNTDEPKSGNGNPLKRSLESAEDSPPCPSKRIKSDDNHDPGEGKPDAEPSNGFTSVFQRGGMESPLYPSLEGRVPEADSEHSAVFSEHGVEDEEDLEYGEGRMDEEGRFYEDEDEDEDSLESRNRSADGPGRFHKGEEQEDDALENGNPEVNGFGRFYEDEEEEIDYDEEEEGGEEEEGEDYDSEEGESRAPKAVIAISNTQDTAFVIDDSDDDEKEGGEEEGGEEEEEEEEEVDADKTLVVETEVTKTVYTKAFLDGPEENEEDEILQQQDEEYDKEEVEVV